MKKTFQIFLVLLALVMCFGFAHAENTAVLGQSFPDFSVTDTQGVPFTLSEALNNHQAVLINIWATWCPPCEAEFPYLNEAYQRYGDLVAFIALSCETEDTADKIETYRADHEISFPMGRDEGQALSSYLAVAGIPTTVIVDRFGNTAYMHVGSFRDSGEISRVIEAFLGDGYTETAVLEKIPAESSTRAFPVSESRDIMIENEDARTVILHLNDSETITAFSVNGDTAHLRLEASAADSVSDLVYIDAGQYLLMNLTDLLDTDRGAYIFDQPVPGPEESFHYTFVYLIDSGMETDPDGIGYYLITGDEYIEEFADELRSAGYSVTWEFQEPAAPVDNPLRSYILHIADQYGAPVPGAAVQFCTDTACTMQKSDENGTVSFSGTPDIYHVRFLQVPAGYSFDAGFELVTGREYGEWILRIKKN